MYCTTEYCFPPILFVFSTLARFWSSLSWIIIRPALALLYCVSSSTFSGYGVAVGLKSHEKQSEHSVAELSQELLVVLKLLLLELLERQLLELSIV